MRSYIAAACLLALAWGSLQLPARAEFNIAFGRHDRNHDGRWSYRDFNDANRYYYRHHPGVEILNSRDLHRDFVRMDTNGDGYLQSSEVEGYRTW